MFILQLLELLVKSEKYEVIKRKIDLKYNFLYTVLCIQYLVFSANGNVFGFCVLTPFAGRGEIHIL